MKTITLSREFFCAAFKIDLQHCTGLPKYIKAAYCVGIVMNSEATHICSLTPSSYVDELRNESVCRKRDADRLHAWLDTNEGADWENEALSGNYYGFTPHNPENPEHADLVEFSDDFEVPDDFDPETDRLPDDVHEELWEQAREYFQGTRHSPACCNYLP